MIHLKNSQGKAKCGASGYLVWTSPNKNEVNCKRCLGTTKRTVSWATLTKDYTGKSSTAPGDTA